MTVTDAAEMLGQDAQNVRYWIRSNKLPAHKQRKRASFREQYLLDPDIFVAFVVESFGEPLASQVRERVVAYQKDGRGVELDVAS